MTYHELFGVWGGMSIRQRQKEWCRRRSALAEHLAGDLAAAGVRVRRGLAAIAVGSRDPASDGWTVVLADGTTVLGRAVVVTCPVPDALVLLDAGNVSRSDQHRRDLSRVGYEPVLAVLIALDGPPAVPVPGGVQLTDGPFSWVADNQAKGLSTRPALTLHASGQWSERLWGDPDGVVLRQLLEMGRDWIGGATIQGARLRRWPWARPAGLHPEPCLIMGAGPPLVVAGDAFGEARVEGAVLSGAAAARAVLAGW